MNLNESLDYMDFKGQIDPKITVDEYKAKMGDDADIVTATFIVNSKSAATDLTSWLELGYDFVLDATPSEGEVAPKKWLVFVEMDRRRAVPERICEMLYDLETLTGFKLKDWTVSVEDEDYDADPEILKQVISLSPHDYREKVEKQKDLNEFRTLANLKTVAIYEEDEYIKHLKAIARI